MPLIGAVRSILDKAREDAEEQRRAFLAREEAALLRQWGRLGDAPVEAFAALPTGLEYERQRLETPRLRPTAFAAQPTPPPPRAPPVLGPPLPPVQPPDPELGGLATALGFLGMSPEEFAQLPLREQTTTLMEAPFGVALPDLQPAIAAEFPSPGIGGVATALTSSLARSPGGPSVFEPVGDIPLIGRPLQQELEFLTSPLGIGTALAAPAATAAGAIGGVVLGGAGEALAEVTGDPRLNLPGEVSIGLGAAGQGIGNVAPAALVTRPGRAAVAAARAPREVAEETAEVIARQADVPIEGVAREVPQAVVPPPSAEERLVELIKAAKPALKETAELRRAEVARRGRQVTSALAGAQTGEEARFGALGAMKGELPTAAFDPPRGSLLPQEIDDLDVMIRDFYRPRPQSDIDAVPTFVALRKILDGNLPNNSELVLLEKVFGEDLVRALGDHRSLGRKVFDEAAAALSLWRTFIVGGEQSVALRQAAIPGLNPLNLPITIRAVKRSLRAGFSEQEAVRITEDLSSRPEWIRLDAAADRAGYRLFTAFRGVAEPLAREEGFTALERTMIGRLARGTPILGQYLRFSERNAVVLLNSMRLDLGAKWLKIRDKLAPSGVASAFEEEEIARAIAVLTGRGKLPANEVAQVLGRALFSAQLQASRIQTPFLLRSGAVRALVAKELVGFLSFGISLLSAAKLSGAADVELDWRSTDFGKIRVGPTRVDVWGGFQPYARLIAQLASGKRKTSLGEIENVNRLEAVENFWANKFAPALNLAVDVRRGETAIGEPLELSVSGVRRELLNRATPLISQDIVDAVREQGSWAGLAITPLVWFGIGVQSYTTQSVRIAQLINEDGLAGRLPGFGSYDEPPQKISELNIGDREAFLNLHEDLREDLEARSAETMAGLSEQELRTVSGKIASDAREAAAQGFQSLASDVASERFGDVKERDSRNAARDRITDILKERNAVIQQLQDSFPSIAEEREAREPISEPQRILRRFFDLNREHEGRQTEEEWAAYEAAFESAFSQSEQQIIQAELSVNDEPLERTWHEFNNSLTDYYERTQPRRRENWRRVNAEGDGILWALGRTACVKRPSHRGQARDAYERLYGVRPSARDVRVC